MKRALWPALVLAALIFFLVWADAPAFRHGMVQSQQACAVNQVMALPPNVDFIVIGTSRIRESVDPELLSEASEGRIRHPMSFARSGKGAARNFSLLNDLLARGARPATVLFELDLDRLMSDKDPKTIPVERDVGFQSFATVLESFVVHPQRPLIERLHNVALKILIKVRTALVYAFSGEAVSHQYQAYRSDGAEAICKTSLYEVRRRIHIRRYEASIQRFDKLFGPSRATAEDDRFSLGKTLHAQTELFHLEKMRALAARHQVQLLVTRMWKAGQPPLSQAALSRIRAVIPEFIYPSAEHVRDSWANFIDATHLNPKGREAYSRWLAEEVSQRANL
jgi:hypothetical protein